MTNRPMPPSRSIAPSLPGCGPHPDRPMPGLPAPRTDGAAVRRSTAFRPVAVLAAAVVIAGAGLVGAVQPAVASQEAVPVALPGALPGAGPQAAPDAAVSVIDLDWVDASRQREVPARLYLPAGGPLAAAGRPLPLVVFSHGLGGSRFGYSHLGRHWAAQGFASLHLQHPGSDRAVWSARVWELAQNLRAAASEANAVARAQDVSFGISALLADPVLGGRIDAARIAVAGHSYGANTALLVAGASVSREVDGRERRIDYRDPRVKAAVLLSVPPFYGEGDPREILRSVRIPTLHLTGTEDTINIPGYRSEPQDRIRIFDALPRGPDAGTHALAVFAGGTHSIFTDRTDRAGPTLNRTVKAATRDLTTAFLRATLDGAPFDAVTRWLDTGGSLLAQRAVQPGRDRVIDDVRP
jgi:predicted dienelactone hydrolase